MAPAADFLSFFARSVRLLAAEAPAAHGAMLAALRDLRIGVECASCRGVVWASPGGPEIFDANLVPDVRIAFREDVVISLVEGRISLGDAVVFDRLVVIGPLAMVARLNEGMGFYVRGAVRSRGLAGLLQEYKAAFAQAATPDPKETRP